MTIYPIAYLTSPFQCPTGNANLTRPQYDFSSSSPTPAIPASSYLKEQCQHLPSCKEKWIRKKYTKTVNGAIYLGDCTLGVYFILYISLYFPDSFETFTL